MRGLLAALAVALVLPVAPAAAEQGDLDIGWGFVGRVGIDSSGDPVSPAGTDRTLVPVRCGIDCGTVVRLDATGRRDETFAPAGTVPFTIERLVEVPSGVLALGAGAARFTTDGQLDTSFVVAPVANARWAAAAQRSADAPIHLGGIAYGQDGACSATDALLHSVSPTGAALGSARRLAKVARYDEVTELAVDPRGSLLVGFHSTEVVSGVRCTGDSFRLRSYVLALGDDGSPRAGFGFHGVVVVGDRVSPGSPSGVGLAVAPAGVVTAAGRELRVLDPATGAPRRTIPLGMTANSVVVDGAGHYVVGGDRVAWIRPDGTPDTAFGTCGYSAMAGRPVVHRGTDVLVRTYNVLYRLTGSGARGAPHRTGEGAWMVEPNGTVHTRGDALWCGPDRPLGLRSHVVGIAAAETRNGYWLATADGTVRAFAHARHLGDLAGRRLTRPVVGIAAHPLEPGYWLVASDGGIFSFGSARFLGSTGAMRLNRPIVGMAPTPSGRGYWLVASDGGIFTFGDARFFGSTGAMRLNRPIVGMAATPSGRGYYLVAADGGIFTFGDARFRGSAVGQVSRAVGISTTPDGRYRVYSADGRVHTPDSTQLPRVDRPIAAGAAG